MSHIFDALRKSQIEDIGIDAEGSAATELLRHVEQQAVLKWKASALRGDVDTYFDTEESADFEPLSMSQVAPIGTPSVTPEEIEVGSAVKQPELPDIFPVLRTSLPDENRLVCLSETDSTAPESFRLLGVRLRHLRRERAIKKLLVTSTIPQEGKSTVAANLACTLALKKLQRVLLVDGDLRRPSLARIFGLGEPPGICEYLEGKRTLTETLYRLDDAGIWIMPAGKAEGNPLELLQLGRLPALMEQLSALFDWIIIDSPPVLPLADTSIWMRHGDGILLVVRQGTTLKRQLQKGLESIESKKLLGAVLNSAKNSADASYYY